MSEVLNPAITKLTPASSIIFEVFTLGKSKTKTYTLAELNITQAMIDSDDFNLDAEIEDDLFNWAYDNVDHRMTLAAPLNKATKDTLVKFELIIDGKVANPKSVTIGEIFDTQFPITHPGLEAAAESLLESAMLNHRNDNVFYEWRHAS